MLSRALFKTQAKGLRTFSTSATRRATSTTTNNNSKHRDEGLSALRRGAKRDPELYPLYFVTAAVFAWAGWRFVQSPTGSDQSAVAEVPGSEPWSDSPNASSGKYKYHPYNDTSRPAQDAPSALNTVVVPNVTLPKSLHDAYNKWGREEYDFTGGKYEGVSEGKDKTQNIVTGHLKQDPD